MNHYDFVKNAIGEELDQYPYFEGWSLDYEEDEDYKGFEHYTLKTIKSDVRIRTDGIDIEIEVGDDGTWRKYESFSYQTVCLWQAISPY